MYINPVTLCVIVILGLVSVTIYLWMRLKDSEKKKRELESRIRIIRNGSESMHLNSIETVLNPHLFKNILNSVQSHAYQTYFALDKLANILDYILYESKNKFVTIKEEIEFAKDLIEVNKIKLILMFNPLLISIT